MGYFIVLLINFVGTDSSINTFNMVLSASALFNYNFNFIAFILIRRNFKSLPREFVSPWGIPGAIVGLFIFWVTTICFFVFLPQTL